MKRVVLYSFGITIIIITLFYFVYILFIKENNNEIKLFKADETKVVIGADLIKEKSFPIVENNQILLKCSFIKKYIDKYVLWDSIDKVVTITTEDKVIRMKKDSLDADINNKLVKMSVPIKEVKDDVYISLEFVKDFYNIEYTYIKSNNVIVIDNKFADIKMTSPISEKAVIRKGMSIRQPIVKKLKDGFLKDKIRIFDENHNWYKIRTADGSVGYIEKKYVDNKIEKIKNNAQKPELQDKKINKNLMINGKLSLAWHAIYQNTSQIPVTSKLDGLDILSPTWFDVIDEKGNIASRANKDYVDLAHSKGYKVWALICNNFSNRLITHKFLISSNAKKKMISDLIVYADKYALDGINIDFENINIEDKENLTQLVREMTPVLREKGLIVSIDINTEGGYNRQELAEKVDYLVLMAYDQHWKSCGKAGSVAEYNWVESLLDLLINKDRINPQKIILGLPFYTRNWCVSTNGVSEKVIDSESYSMEKSMRIVEENKGSVRWDDKGKQFYAEYKNGNYINKMWMEEHNSINWKTSLVLKYNLAGTGAWKINFEVLPVWDIIFKNLKIIKNYNEWQERNKDNVYELIISKKYTN